MMSSQSKLARIEDRLCRLWTNRQERDQYLEAGVGSDGPSDDLKIDPRGVKLYSSLIEIGRMDLMSSIYPVIKELLGKKFKGLVQDYFECMPPEHYNLNQSAKRFPQYLLGLPKLMGRYPFLAELADYEWIELAVLEDVARDLRPSKEAGKDHEPEQFAALIPVLNSVFVCRSYRFAIPGLVEAITKADKLPRRFKQDPTCVVVYRDPDNLNARFLEIGEAAFGLLQMMEQNPNYSYGDLLKEACARDPQNVQTILAGCLEDIEEFKQLKLIVGEK